MQNISILIGLLLFLQVFSVTSVLAQSEETANSMKWYPVEEAQEKAKEEGKKVLVFGYADWCTYCRKMRKEIYSDSSLQKNIDDFFYPIQIDIESDARVVYNGVEMEERELADYLGIISLPTHFFLSEDGEILGSQPGFLPEEVFTPLLNYVGTGAFRSMKFDQFLEVQE